MILPLPFFAAGIMAKLFDLIPKLTFGLLPNMMITRDQLTLLRRDNVVAEGAKGFAEFGIHPYAPGAIIGDYLYSYRPQGQYDAITELAARLKS